MSETTTDGVGQLPATPVVCARERHTGAIARSKIDARLKAAENAGDEAERAAVRVKRKIRAYMLTHGERDLEALQSEVDELEGYAAELKRLVA